MPTAASGRRFRPGGLGGVRRKAAASPTSCSAGLMSRVVISSPVTFTAQEEDAAEPATTTSSAYGKGATVAKTGRAAQPVTRYPSRHAAWLKSTAPKIGMRGGAARTGTRTESFSGQLSGSPPVSITACSDSLNVCVAADGRARRGPAIPSCLPPRTRGAYHRRSTEDRCLAFSRSSVPTLPHQAPHPGKQPACRQDRGGFQAGGRPGTAPPVPEQRAATRVTSGASPNPARSVGGEGDGGVVRGERCHGQGMEDLVIAEPAG